MRDVVAAAAAFVAVLCLDVLVFITVTCCITLLIRAAS